MEQSILKSTRKVLQIGPDDESFDLDILTHINTAFSTLNDLGVGPQLGFAIEDDSAEWADFLPSEEDLPTLSRAKTFVFLQTRILFDPPTTSFLLAAYEKQIAECVWRISTQYEANNWVDPDPPADPMVVDGGDPTGD
jgi:hypothetical protein